MSDMMRYMNQEQLMKELEGLNLKELKQAIAAGVPGHAMYYAHELSRRKRAELNAFLEQQGRVATVETEVEAPEEEDSNGETGIQTSEEGREGDS